MKTSRRVYLDNNATTRVDERVIDYMERFFRDVYGIPSSQFSHSPGIRAKEAIEESRAVIAGELGCKEKEVVFTSGAAESNNLAIKGVARAAGRSARNKIVVSKIEEFSVLNSARSLSESGFLVQEVNVDGQGFVDLDHLQSLLDEKTLLVSIMCANHEVGTVQDLRAVARMAHEHGALIHSDAAAAFMHVPIGVYDMELDLASITSHTIYGPKGVGALFVRTGTPIKKVMDGGYNEFNMRAGVENVPGIAGFGKAVELFSSQDSTRVRELRDLFYQQLTSGIEDVLLNGSSDFARRLPNNLNVSFQLVEGESVVLHLDMRGIAVITGSACFSRALEASHVLLAMGFSHERAHGSIRFSLGKDLTREDIDYTVLQTGEVIRRLRELSPLKTTKEV